MNSCHLIIDVDNKNMQFANPSQNQDNYPDESPHHALSIVEETEAEREPSNPSFKKFVLKRGISETLHNAISKVSTSLRPGASLRVIPLSLRDEDEEKHIDKYDVLVKLASAINIRQLGINMDLSMEKEIENALPRLAKTGSLHRDCEQVVNHVVHDLFEQIQLRKSKSLTQAPNITDLTVKRKAMSSPSTIQRGKISKQALPLNEISLHSKDTTIIQVQQEGDTRRRPIPTKDECLNTSNMKEEQVCPVCFDSITQENLVRASNCGHVACKLCLESYLKELIKENNVLTVKCPIEGCGKELGDSFVENVLVESDIKRYYKLKNLALVNADPLLRWCIRPGCERYNKGSQENPQVICECGMELCFNCNTRWHPGLSCQQAIELEYKEYAEQNKVQLCPSCKTRIEKTAGCNHITCDVCTYQWCWLCRGRYTSDHFNKQNPFGCPNLQGAYNTRETWTSSKIRKRRCLACLKILAKPAIWIRDWVLCPWKEFKLECRECHRDMNSVCKVICFLMLLLIGLLTLPVLFVIIALAAMFVIFAFLYCVLGYACNYFKQRKSTRQALARRQRRHRG